MGGMRAVVQRVSRGEVRVDGRVVGAIGTGLVVLTGVTFGDLEADARARVVVRHLIDQPAIERQTPRSMTIGEVKLVLFRAGRVAEQELRVPNSASRVGQCIWGARRLSDDRC